MPATLEWLNAGISINDCLRRSPLEPVDTRALLMYALGLTRIQLITQSEFLLNAEQASRLHSLMQRRIAGVPIAYLVGEREFYGLRFLVNPAVLIPRPETELLVELALQHTAANSKILDLGTGSGAIAISIAHTRPDCQVSATDISPAALDVAKQNAQHLLGKDTQAGYPHERLQFFLGSWFQACPQRRFHTIVSNPPYIEKNDAHLSQGDLRFEPLQALTDHDDGLSHYRQIIAQADQHLEDGGWLLLEHGYNQSEQIQALLRQHGFTSVQSWQDLNAIWRVSGGQWTLPANQA